MENIAKALIKVQGELKAVPKDAKGYNYRYQTLDDILNMARPILTKNGLALIQQVTTPEHLGHVAIKTMLLHESGEHIEDTAVIPIPQGKGMNEAQQAGSAITYLRRYSISALLGIVSEEDTDAASDPVQKNQPQAKQPAQKQAVVLSPEQHKKKLRQLHAVGVKLYKGDWDNKRAEFSKAFGKKSSNDWSAEELDKIISGMNKRLQDEMSKAEAEAHNVALFEAEGAYAE